jgi:phosphoribosylformylglycinamidine synthase
MKITEIIEKLCASPNIASQKPIFEKYDKNVQGNTALERGETIASVIMPFRDFDELNQEDSKIGIAIATGGNPNFAKISARLAAENAVAEAALKVAMVGGEFLGVTDCLNFGNPEKPEQMGEFVDAIAGIKKVCDELEIPIVSGNVSFYNESAGKSIPPSAIVSVFGKVQDTKNAPALSFKNVGESVFLIGNRDKNLGGSEFLRIMKKEDSRIPKINFELLKNWILNLKKSIAEKEISTANFIGRGGLLISILESSFQNEIGVNLEIPKDFLKIEMSQFLFGESIGVLITTNNPQEIKKEFGDQAIKIGKTCSKFEMEISHNNEKIVSLDLKKYKKIWSEKLRTIF